MIKSIFHCAIFISLIFSCSIKKNPAKPDQEITIGEYVFLFPADFKLIKEQGIDSYIGKVSNGKIEFQFDYGYYSNSLEKSIPEYFSQEGFKINAINANSLPFNVVEFENVLVHLELHQISTKDSSDYTLTYLYQKDTLLYTATIPEDIKNSKIQMDTIKGIIYKFVENEKYIGLYAKNPTKYNSSMNASPALSIVVSGVAGKDKQKVITILKSCRKADKK